MSLVEELRRTPIPVQRNVVFGRYGADKTYFWRTVIPHIALDTTHSAAAEPLTSCNDAHLLTRDYYQGVKALTATPTPDAYTAKIMVRRTINVDLARVDTFLQCETGLRLMIMSGYRSPELQRAIRVTASAERGEDFTHRMFSDPDVYSPHATGGAFDIELWDEDAGALVPTKVPDRIDRHTLEEAVGLSAADAAARANRRIIYHVLASSVVLAEPDVFIAHPYEYWHYGRHERLSAFFAREEGREHPVYYAEIPSYVP